MRVIPFLLVFSILIGGVFIAFQTFNQQTENADAAAERPTVTPRPRPTSPLGSATASATAASRLFVGPGLVTPTTSPRLDSTPQQLTPEPSAQPRDSAASPAPSPAGAEAIPSSIGSTGTPGATPSPPSVRESRLQVGNTGGEGVYLRRTPRMDDRLQPWPENSPMVVIGPREIGDGHVWEKVRAPDGTEGYIPSEYLVGIP